VRIGVPACALLALAVAGGEAATDDIRRLWRSVGGFTPGQIAAVERGEPVAKVLPTDRREIAIMGVVRVRGPRDPLIARHRDITNLRKSDLVLQVGAFGRPPRVEDLEPVAFEPYDLDAPRECLPGRCAIRASADAMVRMRAAVNWEAADARRQSAAAWREMLGGLARGYAAGGDAALPVLANKADPLAIRDELDGLYAEFGFLADLAPDVLRYVREFPRARLEGAEDTIFWSKNDLGLKPVVGITHQTIYAPAGRPAIILQKRIYAVHYVDAGLGITMFTDDGAGGFYLTIVDRVRTRSLVGFTRAIVRSIVQNKSREGIEKVLRSSQRRVESLTPAR
jgi:hypothetical protein